MYKRLTNNFKCSAHGTNPVLIKSVNCLQVLLGYYGLCSGYCSDLTVLPLIHEYPRKRRVSLKPTSNTIQSIWWDVHLIYQICIVIEWTCSNSPYFIFHLHGERPSILKHEVACKTASVYKSAVMIETAHYSIKWEVYMLKQPL